MGPPQSWIDITFPRQEPPLPAANGDPLISFVGDRIRWMESGVPPEAAEHRDKPTGPLIERHAKAIRALCRGYRRVVARYGDALDRGAPASEVAALRAAVGDVAATWRGERGWREDWSDIR